MHYSRRGGKKREEKRGRKKEESILLVAVTSGLPLDSSLARRFSSFLMCS